MRVAIPSITSLTNSRRAVTLWLYQWFWSFYTVPQNTCSSWITVFDIYNRLSSRKILLPLNFWKSDFPHEKHSICTLSRGIEGYWKYVCIIRHWKMYFATKVCTTCFGKVCICMIWSHSARQAQIFSENSWSDIIICIIRLNWKYSYFLLNVLSTRMKSSSPWIVILGPSSSTFLSQNSSHNWEGRTLWDIPALLSHTFYEIYWSHISMFHAKQWLACFKCNTLYNTL